jgi:hypothetical protein
MSRRNATAAVTGLLILSVVTSADAAPPPLPNVPATITQQGRLLNTDGTAATGTVSMVFSLYDSSTGTTAIWTETQSVTLDDGYFSVQLGSMTSLASSTTLTTDLAKGVGLFLGLKVGTDSEMTPREEITTVPYALVAQNAIGDITPHSVVVNGITIITPSGTLAVGSAGATGPSGPAGPAGPSGPAGTPGGIGPTGPTGVTGSPGGIGPTGPAGATGATGATGAAGPAGLGASAGSSGQSWTSMGVTTATASGYYFPAASTNQPVAGGHCFVTSAMLYNAAPTSTAAVRVATRTFNAANTPTTAGNNPGPDGWLAEKAAGNSFSETSITTYVVLSPTTSNYDFGCWYTATFAAAPSLYCATSFICF